MYAIHNNFNKRKCNYISNDNIYDLYLNDIDSKKKYIKLIKNNLKEILDNTHKHIEKYVKYDKNVFDGTLKFEDMSIIFETDIYMAICCTYSLKTINIKIYLLNNIPHRMINNEVYFNNNSIIEKCNKIFDILSYKEIGLINNNLLHILNNLFDIAFYGMIYKK
jgi:hypothetical protein